MKPLALIFLATLAFPPSALRASDDDRDWSYSDHETIRRSFGLSGAGPGKLQVDTFSGYIHVNGYDGQEVRMTVDRHTRAESQSDLDRAKREVKLDISQDGNSVRLYVDGPFRGSHGNHHRDYQAIFDFDLEVPRGTQLTLKGFNHGTIQVRKVDGDFEVHGFNGGVEMEEIGGTGVVHTFNGSIKLAFSRNPARPTEIHSFNGSVDVHFLPGLNADLSFHTFHGGIYSDFELGPLTLPASQTGDGRKFVYRSGNRSMVRAGSGGPEISFHTFNGAIRLHAKTL